MAKSEGGSEYKRGMTKLYFVNHKLLKVLLALDNVVPSGMFPDLRVRYRNWV